MNIRPLTPADAEAWWHLRLEGLETEPRAFGSSPEEHLATTVAAAAERIRALGPDNFILGAFNGHALVSVATLIREASLKERHKAHVYGVYVSASHRGQGVGRDLLQTLIHMAHSIDGLEHLQLAVAATDGPASRLYRKLGFERYGTELHALKLGSNYIDEDLMVLRLHPPGPSPQAGAATRAGI